MPADLVAVVDPYERKRSRVSEEAVRHELNRRRCLELLRSLDSHHPENLATAMLGIARMWQRLAQSRPRPVVPAVDLPLSRRPQQGWQDAEG